MVKQIQLLEIQIKRHLFLLGPREVLFSLTYEKLQLTPYDLYSPFYRWLHVALSLDRDQEPPVPLSLDRGRLTVLPSYQLVF